MKGHIVERVLSSAEYIIETEGTIRETAKAMRVSKSTTHLDLNHRLKTLNPELYMEVSNILEYNKSVRHIRGGKATRERYGRCDAC